MVMTSGTYTPRSSHGTIEMLLKLARADLAAERPEAALADDVVAHLAERVLGEHPRLAGRHLDDAGHLGHDRPGRQAVEQLVDDRGGLPHLLEAHPVAGEAVAVGVGPDLPVGLLPRQRRAAVAAQVPVDAARPAGWRPTGRSPAPRRRG